MASEIVEVILKVRDQSASAGFTKTAEAAEDAAEAVDDANKALDKTERSADRAGKAARTATTAFKSVGVGVAALSAAATAAATAVFKLGQTIADQVNNYNDLSVRTGLAASSLQAFDLAARASGQQLEELVPSLTQFPKRMADFARGTGEAKVAFEALGIEVTDASGQLRSADDVLNDTINALNRIENPTTRAALATQLLGESGGRLLQALGTGEDAIESFRGAADALGITLDEDVAKGAAALQRSLAGLELSLGKIGGRILAVFGGTGGLSETLDTFTTLLVGFSVTGVEVLKRFGTFAADVFTGLNTLFLQAGENISTVADAFDRVAALDFEGARNLIQGGVAQTVGISAAVANSIRESVPDMAGALAEGIAAATETSEALAALQKSGVIIAEAAVETIADGLAGELARAPTAEDFRLGPFGDVTDAQISVLQSALDRIQADLEASAAEQAARAARQQEIRAGAIAGGASLLSGDIGGLLSSAGVVGGPVGAGIAQAVGLLAQIGQEGAGGVAEKLLGFTEDIANGIRAIPAIIRDVIPEFVTSLISELIPALVDAGPDLAAAQLELMAKLPILMAQALAEVLIDALNPVNVGQRIGGLFESIASIPSSFQSGGVVNRTGLALVHEGDRFTSSQGQGTGTTNAALARVGGGGMIVNVQGSVYGVDDLIDVLSNRLGFGGGGFSTVLGNG